MNRCLRITLLIALLVAGSCLTGCIPVPYRPKTTLGHAPAADDQTSPVLLTSDCGGWLQSVAKAVKSAEPRIASVDAASFLKELARDDAGTLSDLMDALRQAPPHTAATDYLLVVGWPTYQQISDQGVAMPGLFGVIGYERMKQAEDLFALLVDLHPPQTSERLSLHTAYSEVAAGMWWGIKTQAMPENALRHRLAQEVARIVSTTHPKGSIRLAILGTGASDGGTALDSSTDSAATPHSPGPGLTFQGFRDYVHSTSDFWNADAGRCAQAAQTAPPPPAEAALGTSAPEDATGPRGISTGTVILAEVSYVTHADEALHGFRRVPQSDEAFKGSVPQPSNMEPATRLMRACGIDDRTAAEHSFAVARLYYYWNNVASGRVRDFAAWTTVADGIDVARGNVVEIELMPGSANSRCATIRRVRAPSIGDGGCAYRSNEQSGFAGALSGINPYGGPGAATVHCPFVDREAWKMQALGSFPGGGVWSRVGRPTPIRQSPIPKRTGKVQNIAPFL